MFVSIKQSLLPVFYPVLVLKALHAMSGSGRRFKNTIPEAEWKAVEQRGLRFMFFYFEWRMNTFWHLFNSPDFGIMQNVRELRVNPDLNDPTFHGKLDEVERLLFETVWHHQNLLSAYGDLKKQVSESKRWNYWWLDRKSIILLDDLATAVDRSYDRAYLRYMSYFGVRLYK